MTKKVKAREVDKSSFFNYSKKAGEFLIAAEECFSSRDWNSSTINAIHSGISFVDSMCAFFLGKRFAGEKHEDVVNLVKTLPDMKAVEIADICDRILSLLKMKNMAEYEERLVKEKEAEKAMIQARKIAEIAKKHLPK